MPDEPILLFLHGVGSGDPADRWRETLARSLADLGYPGLDQVRLIAPKYPKALLHGSDDEFTLPGVTVPLSETTRIDAQNFERRTSALETRIARRSRGTGIPGAQAAVWVSLNAPGLFVRAKNYLGNRNVRALVLRRILDRLPSVGRIVVVGHSLGSVIAADLLRRLPVGLEVVGMVTIGSPLANSDFHVDGLRGTLKRPPSNLAWWVNFWNPGDPVTTGRGVSYVLPWVLDCSIRTAFGVDVHAAETYLADETVADAIGYALYGSRSKDLVAVEKGVDLPLDTLETWALLALRYGYLTKIKLEGAQKQRFAEALRQVQADAYSRLLERKIQEGRPLAALIASLAVDLSDPRSVTPEPARVHYLSKEDAVVVFTSLVAANVIRPFEIKVSKDAQRQALEDLAVEIGVGSQFGSDAIAAADEAQRALSRDGVSWIKWVALGLGAAAIVVATGGLALAAAPGLAGAAVVTSALAAFGPGGMIGGLLTAGVLVSAGGGGIALGLASPTTSAETVEVFVFTQLSAAILRKRQGIDQDPATWLSLVETGIELRRERARLEVISDESAPTLRELRRKLDAIDRALTYLVDAGLDPRAGERLDVAKRPGAEFFERVGDAFRPVDLDGDGIPDRPRAAAVVVDAGSAIREATAGAADGFGTLLRRMRAGDVANDAGGPGRIGEPG